MRGEHLHHLHQRKRKHLAKRIKDLEEYPSRKPFVKVLDQIVLVLAIIGPVFNVPQIYKIFTLQTALGLSLLAWSAYALVNVPWILYGHVHQEKPIIISSTLWFFTNLAIIVGIILYG